MRISPGHPGGAGVPAPTNERWLNPLSGAAALWTLGYLLVALGPVSLDAEAHRFVDLAAVFPFRVGIAIISFAVARRSPPGSRIGIAWLCIALSLGLGVVTTLLRLVGAPLAGVTGVVLAVPQAALLLGGLWYVANAGHTDSRAADWIDAAAILIALGLLGSYFVAGGNPFESGDLDARRWLFLIYLIADGTAVLFCATAWFRRPEGLARESIGLVTIGFAAITVADLAFERQARIGGPSHDAMRDVLVALGFLFVLAGADWQRRFPPPPGSGSTDARPPEAAREVVAPFAILVSTIPMLLLAYRGETEPGHLAFHVTGVVGLLILVLIRQHLARVRTVALARERTAADARFRSLVQRSSDAILQISTGQVIQWASPSAGELAGTIPSLLVGRRIADLAHPDDRDRLAVFLANAREPFARNAALRWRMGRPDLWHDVESVVTDLTGDPDVGSYVLNTRNVTERVRLEQQLRQSQKLEAVGRMAGGIAHDFNNLLAAIISHAQLVREELAAGEARPADLLEIEQTAQRGAALTRRLLSFSRPEAGEAEVQSLVAVVRGMEPLLRRLLLGQVKLTLDLGDNALPVRTAEGQIEQILMNLVINARDAMPDGGTVLVRASARTIRPGAAGTPGAPPGRWAELEVRDEGVGMDATTLARLFEPFFTTKPSGLGTGLGLTTVRGIVRALGGHVHAESAPRNGTVMRVLLPLSSAAPAVASVPSAPRSEPEPERRTVLLVDDESALRSAMQRLLERNGYAVLSAGSAPEALQLLDAQAGVVDLVVTDMVMPGMGGREFVRLLNERDPALPVLCMSGHMEWEAADGDAADAPWRPDRLLAKPFAFTELLERVRSALSPASAR
ncbi:MAG: response regulator [Gemmatimonadetes bacterium]|nr:response regulator [Gemmatimonadota bacterium]